MNKNTLYKEIEVGQRFGRLVVTQPDSGKRYHKQIVVSCLCDCGASRDIPAHSLRSGQTRSCGCLAIDVAREFNTKHGKHKSLEYNSWRMMKTRCLCPTDDHYQDYGGRGITVCQEWIDSFEAFLRDMGPRPGKEYTLDRINVNGNYEPRNCRWSNFEQQCNNRRSNRYITHCGIRKSLTEWCKLLHLDTSRIYYLMKQGLTPHEAVFYGYPRTKKKREKMNWRGCVDKRKRVEPEAA